MRSLALACAVKGAREIAVIGHTDCQVAKTSAMKLLESFKTLGVDRHNLPENLTEFFGLFASEQQNVIKGVEFVRQSPLVGPRIPVHGLMVDIGSGRLEWVVNGYRMLETGMVTKRELPKGGEHLLDGMKSFASFQPGEMKFPEAKIGEVASVVPKAAQPEPAPSKPAPRPAPPPLLPRQKFQLPPKRPGTR
jgi:carbonic anhydrase